MNKRSLKSRKSKPFSLTKTIALTVALALTMQSAIPVHADDLTVGNTAGNTGYGQSGAVGNATTDNKWSSHWGGYRFYVINENLERISPIYDFLFTSPAVTIEKVCQTTRHDTPSSPAGHYKMTINDLQKGSLSSKSVPEHTIYTNSRWVGNGDAFRDWFLDGKSGSTITTVVKPSNPTGNSNNSSGNTSSSNNNSTESTNGNQSSTEEKGNVDNYFGNNSNGLSGITTNTNKFPNTNFDDPWGSKEDGTKIDTNTARNNVFENFYPKSSSISINSLNLLIQSIPLSNESGGAGMPAYNLLNESSLMQTIGYETAALALQDGCLLIVEPITWLKVKVSGGFTYGTYYNLINEWDGKQALIKSAIEDVLPTGLSTSKTFATLTGKQIISVNKNEISSPSVSEGIGYINSGYGLGMQVYDASMIFEDIPDQDPVITEVSGEWTLEESEITKVVETADKTTSQTINWNLGQLREECKGHINYCSGCETYTDPATGETTEDCGGHEEKHAFTLSDSRLTYKLKNSLEDNFRSILAKSNSFTTYNNEVNANRAGLSAENQEVSGFNYEFIIHRGSDKLTIKQSKPINDTVLELNYNSSNISNQTRRTQSYEESLNIKLVDDSIDTETSARAECGETDTDNSSTEDEINYTGKVAVKVYAGASRTVHEYVENFARVFKSSLTKGVNVVSGQMVQSGARVKFYPYIRMTYQAINSDGTPTEKKDVNVLSEFNRTIVPNDYAEVIWNYKEENLKVQSQLWMTDTSVTQSTGKEDTWKGLNRVLKGGAAYQLKIDEAQTVNVRTYQTIIEGDFRNDTTINGNYSLLESEAIAEHNKFVQSVEQQLTKLNVELWINKNPLAETAWSDGGFKVTYGTDISALENGTKNVSDYKASTESKYYLAEETDSMTDEESRRNASCSGLNTAVGTTSKKYYKFYSDTSGNIYMIEGTDLNSVKNKLVYDTNYRILTKTQNASNLSSGSLAYTINNKTLVVEKIVQAIERNTGNDRTASWAVSDGTWYNEALDGIIVVVQTTPLKVNFDDVLKTKTTVLDPKLIPYTDNKSDMNNNAHILQYKTSSTDGNVVGEFKGKTIVMSYMDRLFNSRPFYVTNNTVQNTK